MDKLVFETHVAEMLKLIGEDVEREGLVDTPSRVAKAWESMFSGYNESAEDVLKTFRDGAEASSTGQGMIVVGNIPLYSHCEHHLAPIFGEVHVGYVPDGCIVGLSKFKRLVDVFGKRLQVQERLTRQIHDALMTTLAPKGLAVLVEARHMCMEQRGVSVRGAITRTTMWSGCLAGSTGKAEFFQNLQNRSTHL